jgi:hypothetical protein
LSEVSPGTRGGREKVVELREVAGRTAETGTPPQTVSMLLTDGSGLPDKVDCHTARDA